jgi:eukaryotic-like serine/threonine-protein kinase
VDSRPPRSPSKPNLGDVAAKSRASALVGTVVSQRYRIVDLLAMGGVGAVYLAEHVHMQKHVAIKLLHPDSQGLPDMVARFEREAVAGAHVQHPNVAAATDFGELPDGSFFLVLEYVRGTTLREVIKRGPLPAGRVVRIGRQIAAALGAAHAMGIVHRDLKPRNVMLIEGERDVVKLIDFGIAKLDLKQISDVAATRAAPIDDRITTSGAVFGTIAYLSPESALGMDTVDARSDLYALGVVLYEMLAGKHPFNVGDPVALFKSHARDRPPPIAERAPGVVVPPTLEAVVMRLLEKAPDARYQSADVVAMALDASLDVSSPTPAPIQLGEAMPIFPGPSMLPPPLGPGDVSSMPAPATVPSSPEASPEAPPVPAAPPAAARVRWPYAAALVALSLAAAAVWLWPSSDRRSVAPAGSVTAAPSAPAVVASVTATAATATATAAETASPPAPSATAAASAAAAAGSFDPLASRTMLRSAAAAHDWPHATEAFFALVDHAPAAFHDPVLLAPTRDAAAAAAVAGGEAADRVFAALGQRLGADGVDILYEIVRTRGGSKAAVRAEELLLQSEVLARATPAMRITFAFWQAPCADKSALLDRAVADGDARTLVVMQTVGAACLGKNPALGEALKALKARLKAR